MSRYAEEKGTRYAKPRKLGGHTMTEKQYDWIMRWKHWHIAVELTKLIEAPGDMDMNAKARIAELEKEVYAPWKPYRKKERIE